MASTMNNGKELADYCVEFGQSLGCSFVEARYVKDTTKGLAYRNGEPVSGGFSPSSGIGVRVLANGNIGFAAFDRLERSLAEDSIRAAYKMAKNAKRKVPIDLGEPIANKAKWRVKAKEPLEDVTIDVMMDFAKDANKQMEGLAAFMFMLNPSVIDKYIVTSEGTQIEGYLSYLRMFTTLTAQAPGGSEQKYLDLTLAGGWERIEETNLLENLKDEVNRLRRAAETSQKLDELMSQPIDMIVGPEVAGIIAHENVGHPSEGDRIMGREGAQAGESFWRDLKIGESRVGSDIVNVSENPTIEKTSGYYEYDDEGVKSRKRELIKNGIINEPLLNREFGVRFGTESNGAARASGYNREPIIRMANTYFEPGDFTFEELVEDVKLGVFMRSFQEWNIDDRRYQSKYTGSEAYLIRNGEITETMVKRPVMETTSVGLLSAVDGVSKNLRFDFPGTCGKSDPSQGVPVYAGGGDIRFRGIRLGGVG
ncbi:MAG: TldD/PmbA family protein [Candidatus Thorarchaeota archaeon]|nr:TldD/PmbA family protein [Candidatus Thorarchaeota archaeon]